MANLQEVDYKTTSNTERYHTLIDHDFLRVPSQQSVRIVAVGLKYLRHYPI